MRKERKTVILNVDDVDAVRYGTTRVLKKAGFEVWEAASGQEALNKAQDMPDLVILNVNLPDISRFEVCKRIKSDPATKNIPVLHLSATYTGAKKRITDLDYSANGYLVQPMEPDELVAHVRVLLRIKEAEETASREAKQWHVTFDAANDAICTLDREQKIQHCNKAFSCLLGKESGDITGRHCWELIHGTQGPPPECPITRMKKSLRREYIELAIGQSWFLVTVDPILDEAGVLAGGVHTLHDITERKRTEEALKFTRFSLDNAADAMVCVGHDGRYIDVNDTFCRTVGYSREELFLMNVHDIDPNYPTEIWPEFWEKLKQSGSLTFESCHRTRGGKVLPVEITADFFEYNGKEYHCAFARDITERKRVEEALRQAEENFRRSLDESPLGVRIVTIEGETIYANRKILDIYGYDSIDELKATPVMKRYTPESFAKHQIRREKRKRGDYDPSEYEIRVIRKDGEVRHLQVFRKEILWDGERQFQVLYNDITDRKRAEEALQKSEAFFKAVTENSLDITSILDKKGTITYASPSIERFSGYKPEELIGKSVFDFILPADLPRAIYDFGKAVLTKKDVIIPNTFRCRHKNSSERVLEGTGNNLLDYPAVAGFVVNFRDITDRKILTDAIQAERDKLEIVTKNIGVGLAIISKDYRTIWANDVIKNVFGETEGKLCYVTYNHKQTICPWCGVRRVFEAGEDNVVTEAEGYDKDGNWIWSQIIATPIRDESGEITAALEVVVPITERKRVEEEIKSSNKQLRALAERQQQIREETRIMIAREIHDELGGGLTGLKMDLASMLQKVSGAEAGKEERVALMDKIHTSSKLVDHMIQVIRRIATYLRPSILDDLGLLAALEWQLEEFTSHTEIPYEFATDFDYVNLEQDTATAVFRIFQEVLTNVARHSGATKVTVLLREENENFFLETRDNGRGITEGEILDTKSLGILGMRERALVFGGELRISGEPGGGTAVILKIPQKQEETS